MTRATITVEREVEVWYSKGEIYQMFPTTRFTHAEIERARDALIAAAREDDQREREEENDQRAEAKRTELWP